ncbi:thioredoxin-related transmembrane protein 2-like [Corticium candelabrum]|uniref:thioredoxin-related transmembrane protein 2-like n=1 Tax=Corticium candelabrum TaxID=121492 RepID=UPI002E26D672|nr:thioredoxin-related transmembrane protein 2-like [Corticium candelabrum]
MAVVSCDVVNVHYVVNGLAACSYFLFRLVPSLCLIVFADQRCELDSREVEIFVFLCCVVVLKARRMMGDWRTYLDVLIIFSKAANIFLFGRASIKAAAWYSIVLIVLYLAFPEKPLPPSEKVKQLTDSSLKEVLSTNSHETWLVLFYAPWAPPSVKATNVFSKLADKYVTESFQFGRMDISRYPAVSDRYSIDMSHRTKQLPTIILYENGKETARRPAFFKKQVETFQFTEDNIRYGFALNDVVDRAKVRWTHENRKNK